MICTVCGYDKPKRMMSKDTGSRRYVCKICTCEQVKRSQRAAKWSAFVADVSKWPDQKLASEREWLIEKLLAIESEERRRRRKLKA